MTDRRGERRGCCSKTHLTLELRNILLALAGAISIPGMGEETDPQSCGEP
jgi:hypothetical protein